MKKLLLILAMLILIVGVSYVKIIRQHDRQAEAYDAGKKTARTDVMLAEQAADSLRTTLAQREVAFGDTMTAHDAAHRAVVDSMAGEIQELDQKVDRLSSDLARAKKSAAKTASAPRGPSRHEQILTYYKQRYRELPGDLSSYEQTVAIREVRQETADKFKITVAELNRIRSEHKLDY